MRTDFRKQERVLERVAGMEDVEKIKRIVMELEERSPTLLEPVYELVAYFLGTLNPCIEDVKRILRRYGYGCEADKEKGGND